MNKGLMIGIIVIVVVAVAGSFYYFGKDLNFFSKETESEKFTPEELAALDINNDGIVDDEEIRLHELQDSCQDKCGNFCESIGESYNGQSASSSSDLNLCSCNCGGTYVGFNVETGERKEETPVGDGWEPKTFSDGSIDCGSVSKSLLKPDFIKYLDGYETAYDLAKCASENIRKCSLGQFKYGDGEEGGDVILVAKDEINKLCIVNYIAGGDNLVCNFRPDLFESMYGRYSSHTTRDIAFVKDLVLEIDSGTSEMGSEGKYSFNVSNVDEDGLVWCDSSSSAVTLPRTDEDTGVASGGDYSKPDLISLDYLRCLDAIPEVDCPAGNEKGYEKCMDQDMRVECFNEYLDDLNSLSQDEASKLSVEIEKAVACTGLIPGTVIPDCFTEVEGDRFNLIYSKYNCLNQCWAGLI
jgi:hypothetical protein